MRPHKSVLTLIAVCILTIFAAPAFAKIIYVNATASGWHNGTSWAKAYTDLRAAIGTAASGDEIWVAAGTYKPTTTKDRTISFVMKAGVKIYGGFAGNETAITDRDWVANTTTLSGDIGTSGDASDNSYHVVTSAGATITDTAVLDGFTISGGNADGSSYPDDYGGGMFNNDSSPTVTNCTFSGNKGISRGGGMFNDSNSPTVTNCTFYGNTTTDIGGGMYNISSNPTMINCTFSGNSALQGGGMFNLSSRPVIINSTFSGNTASYGGGMYNITSNPTVTNSTFSGNTAIKLGGGIYNMASKPTVTNCTFSGNTVTNYYGGGMYNESSSPTVTNCTFSGNSALQGGGMYNDFSSPTVTNCTFFGNTATNHGGGMCNGSSSSPAVTNCTFSGNTASSGGGMYNKVRPTVTNCILWDNSPNEILGGTPVVTYSIIKGGFTGTDNLDTDPLFVNPASGNYRLQGTSPAIDAGSDIAIPSGITTDLDGNLRITGAAVDIGAYELAPEINVKQGTTNIASAGSYDFGNVAVGSDSGAITFTIENTGTADLSLSGTTKITLSGTDAADFSVDETLTTSPVAASGMTTFTVTFTPSSDVAKTAILTIANDDSDENPYTVTLTGTGTDGTTIPPVIPGPPLPIVITAEVSNITVTGAASGGNVVYPEGCTVLLVGRGVAWDTVSPPTYPQDAHTFDGWESGEYTSSLTNLVPQTKYYIRAYVQYKLHNVLYTRYSEYI